MERGTDIVIVTAWTVVLGVTLLRARLGSPARLGLGVVLAVAVVLLGVRLELVSGGRLAHTDALATIGAVLAVAGAALYVRALAAIGPAWASSVAPGGPALVADGPYAVVRHPLYAGVLLLGLGTVLGHPSLATACGGVGLAAGLAVKIRREERALERRFPAEWAAYRARVPALLPRLRRRG